MPGKLKKEKDHKTQANIFKAQKKKEEIHEKRKSPDTLHHSVGIRFTTDLFDEVTFIHLYDIVHTEDSQ
jgi:hypothetical protein